MGRKLSYTAQTMYWSCLKKAKFKTKAQAEERAKKYGQRVYQCPLCGGWHLTKHLDREYEVNINGNKHAKQ